MKYSCHTILLRCPKETGPKVRCVHYCLPCCVKTPSSRTIWGSWDAAVAGSGLGVVPEVIQGVLPFRLGERDLAAVVVGDDDRVLVVVDGDGRTTPLDSAETDCRRFVRTTRGGGLFVGAHDTAPFKEHREAGIGYSNSQYSLFFCKSSTSKNYFIFSLSRLGIL